MPAQKVTLSEGLAAAAFVISTFGVSFAFYRLVADFQEGTIAIGIKGWHYAFGVLPWLFILLSAVAVGARRIPGAPRAVRRALPFVAAALAALALVFVIVAFADRPDQQELSAAIVQHVDRAEIEEIAAQALTWTPIGTGIGYGAGLYLLAVATVLAVVAAAAQLVPGLAGRLAPTGAAQPDGSVSPPAAVSSGTAGVWQTPAVPFAAASPEMVENTASSPGADEGAAAGPGTAGAGQAPAAGQGTVPLVGTGTIVSTVPAGQTEGEELPAAGPQNPDVAVGETGATETSLSADDASAAYCVRCGALYRSVDERFCTRCGAPRQTG